MSDGRGLGRRPCSTIFASSRVCQSPSCEIDQNEELKSRPGYADFSGQIESKNSPKLVSPELCNTTLAAGLARLASPRHRTHVRRCDTDIGQTFKS